MYVHYSKQVGLLALTGLLILFLIAEYLRIDRKWNIPILTSFYKVVMRGKENTRMGGYVLFSIGAIICYAAFDIRIATAAILMCTFGDLAAAVIGRAFGKIWIPFLKKKAWEGCTAEFLVDVVIGFIIIRTLIGGSPWWLVSFSFAGSAPIWIIIIGMALTATVVETIVSVIDDNLAIPVIAGFVGQMLLMLLNMF